MKPKAYSRDGEPRPATPPIPRPRMVRFKPARALTPDELVELCRPFDPEKALGGK